MIVSFREKLGISWAVGFRLTLLNLSYRAQSRYLRPKNVVQATINPNQSKTPKKQSLCFYVVKPKLRSSPNLLSAA